MLWLVSGPPDSNAPASRIQGRSEAWVSAAATERAAFHPDALPGQPAGGDRRGGFPRLGGRTLNKFFHRRWEMTHAH